MDSYLIELKKLHETYKTDRFSKMGIAIALGVNRRTVRRWFQGKHPPTKRHQKLIKNLIQQLQESQAQESEK
jgi:DNA-binding transcriptional regulator YiaG